MQLQRLNPNTNTEVETFLPAAEKIIAGEPKQQIWEHFSNSNRVFHTGVWQSEVGKWQVSYSEDEYCLILAGVSIVTDADGNANTVKAGDQFVIPAGFSGTWEVVETTRKVYVMYEA